jgi:hypothetical protein
MVRSRTQATELLFIYMFVKQYKINEDDLIVSWMASSADDKNVYRVGRQGSVPRQTESRK